MDTVDSGMGTSIGGELYITELCDTVDSNERFLELYNPGPNAINLSEYSVERFSNGSTSSSASVTLGSAGETLAPNTFFIVAKNQSGFESRWGTTFETIYTSTVDVNGDDVLALIKATNIIDAYGELGVDGSGTAWEYEDRCVSRNATAGSAAFDVNEWMVGTEDDDSNATPGQ
jgi:predicted extracellular nuclease